MNEKFLDACALIAYFNGEEGCFYVRDTIIAAARNEVKLFISKINLLEIYYGFYRDDGKKKAEEILQEIYADPIEIIDAFSDEAFYEAGRLKASYDISFADSVALGFASAAGRPLITADHHEFDKIEKTEKIIFEWIR